MAAVTGGLKAMLESNGGGGGVGAEQQQMLQLQQQMLLQNGGGDFAPTPVSTMSGPCHHNASAPVAIGTAAAVRARAAPIAIPGTAPNGEF